MFTDIVGYTALMSKDEKRALALLNKNREFQKSLVEKHNGEFLKEMGDGTLLCFQSALDAIHCAMEIQNSAIYDLDLNIRIGIHLGDINFEDGDVFGDGVNVASRIEGLSDPGGIYFSEEVYRSIRNQPDIEVEFIDEKRLKNIDDPIKIYKVKDKIVYPHSNGPLKYHASRFKTYFKYSSVVIISIILFLIAYKFYDKNYRSSNLESISSQNDWENSIAVLPFANISSDTEQEYFCDGMTEQIISSLSRIKRLKVISRTSSMKFKGSQQTVPEIASLLNVKYILECSVRKAEDHIRVTAQLIDAEDDFHIWAEDYDKQLDDVFDLQDDLTKNIITSMLSGIPPGELGKAKSTRSANVEAYEYFLRGKYYHEKKFIGRDFSDESFKLAEMMFKKSIDLDSTFALPYVALADLYHSYYVTSIKGIENRRDLSNLMDEYLNVSFSLDSTLAYNYLVQGRIHALNNNVPEAFISLRNAIRLKPNNGWYNQGLGSFFFNRGLHKLAIQYLDKSIALDPLEPLFYVLRGINYQWLGKVGEAENDYMRALQLEPHQIYTIENYIHLLIEESRFEEAGSFIDKLDERSPSFSFIQAKLFAAKGDKDKSLQLMGNNQNLQIYGILGMKESGALFYQDEISRARHSRISYYSLYKTNPCYDKLRDDPLFQDYLSEHKKIYDQNLTMYGKW